MTLNADFCIIIAEEQVIQWALSLDLKKASNVDFFKYFMKLQKEVSFFGVFLEASKGSTIFSIYACRAKGPQNGIFY